MHQHEKIVWKCPCCKYTNGRADAVKTHVKTKHSEFLGTEEYKAFSEKVRKRHQEKVVDEESEEEVVGEDAPAAAESSRQAIPGGSTPAFQNPEQSKDVGGTAAHSFQQPQINGGEGLRVSQS
jgi:hypothetical protein